jgi:hypothetical protein
MYVLRRDPIPANFTQDQPLLHNHSTNIRRIANLIEGGGSVAKAEQFT